MSSQRRTEIECILRLNEMTPAFWYEITEWLLNLKLIHPNDYGSVTRTEERARFVVNTLQNLLEKDKLILVDYTWTRLPSEYIRLHVITLIEQKEFTCSKI
jgi:hypothetical protein